MQQQEIVDEVKNAPLEVKKEVLREALETASEYGNAGVLLSHAVSGASVEATRDAVIKAVKSADGDEAQELITEAINAASNRTAKSAIDKAGLSPETLDQIWLFIVKTFGYVLCGSAVALAVTVLLDVFYPVEPDHVQIMLTVFTTVAGILAGFITGQAVGTATERGKDNA
ncbi:MAG: hypothetical protein ACR2HO_03350 [Rubrobacteraceae bacterium]|nr:hypothetical protein [Rubrobacter sp.]